MKRQPRSAPVPTWAALLIAQVCADNGRRAPKVTWYNAHHSWSSGVTYRSEKRIHVTAGTVVAEQQIIVLHELAHYLGPKGEHHTMRYWRRAVALYDRWLDADGMEAALRSEWHYKLKARQAFFEWAAARSTRTAARRSAA